MSFGSNEDDWVCPLRKIELRVFWPIIGKNGPLARVLRHGSVGNESAKNPPNMSFGSNKDDWVRPVAKNSTASFYRILGKMGFTDAASAEI